MEPTIHSLLDESLPKDNRQPLPHLRQSDSEPAPVQLAPVTFHNVNGPVTFADRPLADGDTSTLVAAARPSKSAPLTKVLNKRPSTGFSGSVSDLLLDDNDNNNNNNKNDSDADSHGCGNAPNSNRSSKRRKIGHGIFTLPKPTLPIQKSMRRARIPPLHQPPPDAGLFPPIIGARVDSNDHRSLSAPRLTARTEAALATTVPATSALASRTEVHKAKEWASHKPKSLAPTLTQRAKQHTGKRRRKWTDEETKVLLRGVQQFGIGYWKKILEVSGDFLEGRSAVDLKDRFRTCCPDQYRKTRMSKAGVVEMPPAPERAAASSAVVTSNGLSSGSVGSVQKKKPGPKTHQKAPSELGSMGFTGPFAKSTRRERREFTELEDDALLRGFEMHGPYWTDIRNNTDLDLTHRQPTDLRDRFRNRWPEKYTQAGCKVKVKAKEQHGSQEKRRDDNLCLSVDASSRDNESELSEKLPSSDDPASVIGPKAPDLKALLPTYPFPDISAADDCSPVTLSRDIFSYARRPANTHDLSTSSHVDHGHINPLDTLKIPKMTGGTHQPYQRACLPPVWLSAPLTADLPLSSGSNLLPVSPTALSRGTTSARGTSTFTGGSTESQSLPGPADLLSRLELDAKAEGNPSILVCDNGTCRSLLC